MNITDESKILQTKVRVGNLQTLVREITKIGDESRILFYQKYYYLLD